MIIIIIIIIIKIIIVIVIIIKIIIIKALMFVTFICPFFLTLKKFPGERQTGRE